MIFADAPCYDSSLLNEAIRASWRFHDDLWTRKRPQRTGWSSGRRLTRETAYPWIGMELSLSCPRPDVNLIFLDRGCLDKDTNWNEAIAVSRITQNDQIGLLEPG
jgi:hypothetical protein